MNGQSPVLSRCQVCDSTDTALVYTAPLMPLGAQLIAPERAHEPELFYPLHYAICRRCSTFQSIETVPAGLIRSENTYVSATSSAVTARDRALVGELMSQCRLTRGMSVVEIGGSDGVFLRPLAAAGMRVLNIEPVADVAARAAVSGIETVTEFFSPQLAEDLARRRGRAQVIVAKHVLELVPDLHAFMTAIDLLLADDGYVMMEVPYIVDLMNGNFYDILAHLRKYHFSLTGMNELFVRHGLRMERVVNYPELGGGLRIWARRVVRVHGAPEVDAFLKREETAGIRQEGYYRACLRRGDRLRDELLAVVRPLAAAGERIVGYGAGIKASALLNFCGLHAGIIPAVVDNGAHKQGKLMPGARIPVFSPDLIDGSVGYVLILSWLHQEEIMRSLKGFLAAGGRVIVPTPAVSIITG